MRILIVEDDPKNAALLARGLAENGFTVDVADRGDDGRAMARNATYDLVILDVMLPAVDGWTILADIRTAGRPTPVLFLTARDGVDDRVKGLELGADDYLVKPFAFSELLARVRSVLRRSPARQSDTVRVADLELDAVRHKASRGGVRLDLTPKEFALLSLLARRAGEALSRTVIADQVWGFDFDGGPKVVDVHVWRLRAKVDDPFELKLIHTVRGLGYVLEDRG